jgi:hypothetical protein
MLRVEFLIRDERRAQSGLLLADGYLHGHVSSYDRMPIVVTAVEQDLMRLDRQVVIEDDLPTEFECASCGELYDDGSAVITVRRPKKADAPLCTDRCAEAFGFVDAVLARKRAEARGDAICIVYLGF